MSASKSGRPNGEQPGPATGAPAPPDPAFADDLALFLDVDGTLLDIAETPDGVTTPTDLIGALAQVDRKLAGAIALVSGRPIEELDRLFAPLHLRASGVHGAEMRFNPLEAPRTAPNITELPESLTMALDKALGAIPGASIEQKRYSAAVHFRSVPDAGPRVREILQRLIERELPGRFEIIEAHCAFELKARGFDKGKAIGMFLNAAPFAGRMPIFIGDDATDESGFAAVAARGGRAYSVGRWRPGASGVFDTPRAVRAWLAALAN
jgi:trehalose 6-phosphate phosphatase